jgi:predicted GNAT family acetyltransferase
VTSPSAITPAASASKSSTPGTWSARQRTRSTTARGSRQRIFYHTVINEEYGGQGLAGQLATAALDETVGAGLGIVPVCPFIKKFLTKHPEYADSTVRVAPAHLEFLDSALAARTR